MIEYDKFIIGKVIRRERKARKLSQEVFSGLTGMARSHLSMIENGEKQANFETLWRIANTLEIAPHQLVYMIECEINKSYSGKDYSCQNQTTKKQDSLPYIKY